MVRRASTVAEAVRMRRGLWLLVLGLAPDGIGHAVHRIREAPSPPRVDPALSRTVVPVVRDHLERDIVVGGVLMAYGSNAARGFCRVHIIEVARRGTDLLAESAAQQPAGTTPRPGPGHRPDR
jgi:hypothetical protein